MENTPEFWDGLFAKGKQFVPVEPEYLDRILDRVSAILGRRPATGLDLGCGTGQLTLLAAQRGIWMKGLDISAVGLSTAQEQLAAHPSLQGVVAFEQRDFNSGDNRPEPDKVDVAFMKLAFTFVHDRLSFLRYVRESLSEGGVFVLMTPTVAAGREYSNFAKFISAPLEETERFLRETFSHIEVFEREDHGEDGVDMTYLLSGRAVVLPGMERLAVPRA